MKKNKTYVVIITSESDFSTTKVIDWLRAFKQPYIIINENILVELKYVYLENKSNIKFSLCIKNKVNGKSSILNHKNIKSVWYRRGNFAIHYLPEKLFVSDSNEINNYFQAFYKEQNKLISQFLSVYISSNFKHVNKLEDNFLNKLDVLRLASECGLEIPYSLITSYKNKINFNSKYINKTLTGSVYFKFLNDNRYFSMTETLSNDKKKYIPESFPPSFFQSLIEKEFELRIFFINRTYYSMAIISQNDEQTKVDFRNYNDAKPNRFLPYKLPKEIIMKLNKLMRKININCGSIDIIIGKDGKYYFLEVNPVGQYDMTSGPCNYYLHYKIAEYLTN
jgi:ATP-GRASP peptide maturase of grasp-with-spasm system